MAAISSISARGIRFCKSSTCLRHAVEADAHPGNDRFLTRMASFNKSSDVMPSAISFSAILGPTPWTEVSWRRSRCVSRSSSNFLIFPVARYLESQVSSGTPHDKRISTNSSIFSLPAFPIPSNFLASLPEVMARMWGGPTVNIKATSMTSAQQKMTF